MKTVSNRAITTRSNSFNFLGDCAKPYQVRCAKRADRRAERYSGKKWLATEGVMELVIAIEDNASYAAVLAMEAVAKAKANSKAFAKERRKHRADSRQGSVLEKSQLRSLAAMRLLDNLDQECRSAAEDYHSSREVMVVVRRSQGGLGEERVCVASCG